MLEYRKHFYKMINSSSLNTQHEMPPPISSIPWRRTFAANRSTMLGVAQEAGRGFAIEVERAKRIERFTASLL